MNVFFFCDYVDCEENVNTVDSIKCVDATPLLFGYRQNRMISEQSETSSQFWVIHADDNYSDLKQNNKKIKNECAIVCNRFITPAIHMCTEIYN